MNHADEVAADIDRAVAGRTLLDVFAGNARDHADAAALRWRTDGRWTSLTWREYREQVEHATLGLCAAGMRPGDRVGILMSNRPELAIADLAVLHARAVPVCLFDSFTDEQLSTVLRTLDIGLVIAGSQAEWHRLTQATGAAVVCSIVVDPDGDVAGGGVGPVPWERVMATGREYAARRDGSFDRYWQAARPDDVVSVNYTSGTTGSLKGVQHSHRNVLWHAESFARFLPLPPGTRFLSYLPRAHATERFVTTWYPLTRAGTVHLCPDPARLPAYLLDVRPQFFGGVLRVWEKMYASVAALPAAGAGAAAFPAGAAAQRLRAGLGLDECGFAFSGGGALAPTVQEFFNAIGVPLTEGWGQSELVSAATCAGPDQIRVGTVGRPLPGVSVRTGADGELLVRSGSRMVGYVTPVADAGLVDADGWVHTGDLGMIDAAGYVRVLGRRGEIVRLADGYAVSATRVESQLKTNGLVDHAVVVGEERAELCALLVVGAPPERWDPDDLVRIVRDGNRYLPARERIARIAILAERWEPGAAEELTHTGKIKRSLVATKYADLIGALCRGEAGTEITGEPGAGGTDGPGPGPAA